MKYRYSNNSSGYQRSRVGIHGFTLVELLVVILVLAFAMGVTATSYQQRSPGAAMESEARKLTSMLRVQRARAMTEGIITIVEPEDNQTTYRVTPGEKEHVLPDELYIECEPAQQVSARPVAGIRFYPDGSSSGGHCRLRSGSEARIIEVHWLTGGVALGKAESE